MTRGLISDNREKKNISLDIFILKNKDFIFFDYLCNLKVKEMRVAIVKYNAGNIYSVVNALHRMGIEPLLTDEAEELMKADKVLFPGQGEARSAMQYLRERRLDEVIRSLTQPVLGICVGQQLLCRHSEEGDTPCIGIFDAEVKRFRPQHHEDKVPCMGWGPLQLPRGGALLIRM